MAQFEYRCCICGYEFEKIQPLGVSDCATCPICSCKADKKLSVFNYTFGFTLSDKSRWVKGHKDEFVRNI